MQEEIIEFDHLSIDGSQNSDNEPKQESQISPWMSLKTKSIKNPNIRLHNEIIEFYQFI